MIKQFEELLNKQIEKGWKCSLLNHIYIGCNINLYAANCEEGYVDLYFFLNIDKENTHNKYITYNDLLFGDSGFLESLEWKYQVDHEETFCNLDGMYQDTLEYHKIRLLLLNTNEERIEYLLSNIIQ